MTGFVPATLVHTKSGTMRIDQLRVGDLVFARIAGSDPTPALRPVTHLRGPQRLPVKDSGYMDTPTARVGTRIRRLFTTYEQAFWVVGTGWIEASRLLGDWMGPSPLVSIDGSSFFSYPQYVYQTGDPNIGWIGAASLEEPGQAWDFAAERFLRSEPFDHERWPQDPDARFPGLPFETMVCTIAVADADSIFVGEHGIQVRAES